MVCKIILVGDSNVGKADLLTRLSKNELNLNSKQTIGVEFATWTITTEIGDVIRAQIWDTAGQERYRSIASSYFRGASGALLVYDIANRKSFENLKIHLGELRTHGQENMTLLLVGNQTNLVKLRQVQTVEAEKFAEL